MRIGRACCLLMSVAILLLLSNPYQIRAQSSSTEDPQTSSTGNYSTFNTGAQNNNSSTGNFTGSSQNNGTVFNPRKNQDYDDVHNGSTLDPLENYIWKDAYEGKVKHNGTCGQPYQLEEALRGNEKESKGEAEGENEELLKEWPRMGCDASLFLECVTDQYGENYEKENAGSSGRCECSHLVGGKNAVQDKKGKCRIPVDREFDSECTEPMLRLPYRDEDKKFVEAECTENAVCRRHGMHVGMRCYCQSGFRPTVNGTCNSINSASHLGPMPLFFLPFVVVLFSKF